MLTLLSVEFSKLKGSLVSLLVLLAPLLIPVFLFFRILNSKRPIPWEMVMMMGTSGWLMMLLALMVIALCVLMSQMEHANAMWSHLYSLPVPRWKIILAKILVVLILVLVMTLLVPLASLAAGHLAGLILPNKAPSGELSLLPVLKMTLRGLCASLSLIAIQLWVSLRFRSFVVPLLVGIGGVFFAVNAANSQYGVYFPWLMPTHASLASDPAAQTLAMLLGGSGGAVLFLAMLWDLGRREMTLSS